VPKTGTHSVRQALRLNLGPQDEEQARLFVEKRLSFPELAQIGHGHISLAQLRPFVGEQVFAGYFKFAFVRNPFDRFVSYCAFATRKQDVFERHPQQVMRHFLFTEPPLQHMLFRPQHSFLIGADGELLTDALGRVEDMQGSFDAISERIGLPHVALERTNASQHGDYRDYYDQQLIDGVASLYGRDLELFGYQF
jgi:hypothetical protein